jgi:hypothetical protein
MEIKQLIDSLPWKEIEAKEIISHQALTAFPRSRPQMTVDLLLRNMIQQGQWFPEDLPNIQRIANELRDEAYSGHVGPTYKSVETGLSAPTERSFVPRPKVGVAPEDAFLLPEDEEPCDTCPDGAGKSAAAEDVPKTEPEPYPELPADFYQEGEEEPPLDPLRIMSVDDLKAQFGWPVSDDLDKKEAKAQIKQIRKGLTDSMKLDGINFDGRSKTDDLFEIYFEAKYTH